MRLELKLLITFIPFIVGVGGVTLFLSMRAEQQLVEEVTRDLQDVVRTVHFSTQKLSAEPGRDREALERFIEEVKRNKGVGEVSVVGSNQEVVASSDPQKIGERRPLDNQDIVVREQFGEQKSTDHRMRYEVKIPLVQNDKVIGLVQTFLVVEDYRYHLHQLYVKNVLISAGVIVFAFGVIFIVLNRMAKPLRRVTLAAERVASGDLNLRLESSRRDEVGRLTASFNAMTRKLSDQQQLEDRLHDLERNAILAEMASSLAHEIRNPLNLINLTADHLSQQFQPTEGERRQAYQELIQGLKAEVRHLNQRVNDFLTVGRPAKLHKTKFIWGEMWEELNGLIRHQAAAKGIILEKSGPNDLVIMADQDQIRLVLLNVFLNAIAAAPKDGVVRVEASRNDSTHELVISVADNGPGIAPEDVERIFEPYFTKRSGGTGLGLALAKRIMEEHGGKIQVKDGEHTGARFDIRLPMEG